MYMHERRPVTQLRDGLQYQPKFSTAIGGAQGAKPPALRNCNTLLVLQMQLRGGKLTYETDMAQYTHRPPSLGIWRPAKGF